MSTEHIAYEKRYRDWRVQYDTMFAPENRSPQQDEQFPLADGYCVHSKAYFYEGDLHLCGSEREPLDKEGKVRYAWRNLDTGRWLDLRHVVDPDDSRFDDIEFVRWESSGLIFRGCDVEDGQWKEARVSTEDPPGLRSA